MVELGRIDICTEVSMMSSHLALPRRGHLDVPYHTFRFLKKYQDAELVFDSREPEIDPQSFPEKDWSRSIYGDVKELLPPNMPTPLGIALRM